MSAWHSLLRIFWALKWPMLGELLMVVFWLVVLENAIGLIQREVFDQLTGEASVGLGIWELCAVMVAIGVLTFTMFLGGVVLHDYSNFSVGAILQRNVFSYLMELPAHRSLPSSTGEAISRFRDDAGIVADYMSQFKFFVAFSLFLPTALFIMARIDVVMTFGVFVPIAVVVVIVNLLRGRIQRYRKESRQATGDVTGFIGEMFGAAEAIKVADAEERVLGRFDALNAERKRTTLRDTLLGETLGAVFSNVQNIGTGFVLMVAARSLGSESFTVGDLSLFVFYLGYTQWLAHEVGRTLMQYRQIGVSLDRLRELMPGARPVELVRRRPSYLFGRMPGTPFTPKTGADRFDSLEVTGLTYVHPGSGRGVRDVDLGLRRGQFTVVTGRIGSGKSTLLRALVGSLPRQSGEIRWNGTAVADPAAHLVPPRCAYVSQTPRLFSEALRQNILLGLPESRVDLDGAVTDRRDGARPRGDGRRIGDGCGPPGRAAVGRPGAAVGVGAHVRQGARAAGLRRRVERARRRDGAAAMGARFRAGGRHQPGRVASPRGLPQGGPHRRAGGRARGRGGQARRPAAHLGGDASPLGGRGGSARAG